MANAATSVRHCLACDRPLPTRNGPGRTRLYCDATCRSKARRTRQATDRHVNPDLTNGSREGNLDNVPKAVPPRDPQLLTRVLNAARVAVDGVPPDPALTPLTTVTAVRSLARVVEEGLREAVQNARQAGHTWAEIGELLDTTRQAAFQRFGRPIDPRTNKPMTRQTLPGAEDKAIEILGCIIEGRWEDARRDFGEKMLGAVSADRIALAWAQTVAHVGSYERMGEPLVFQANEATVTEIPLFFEAGDSIGQVTFDRESQVIGLFLRPAPS